MASGTAPAEQRVIERQLRVARRQVKLIDLATRGIVLIVGVCAYLAALVVVDHWLWGLGAVQRWLALVGLIAGVAWYLVQHVGRYLLRGINPVYAARVIEDGAPGLKNSLINYLLLRSERTQVPEPVFLAVERRAAADVEPLHVEAAIDHSSLFRLSYVLVGVAAIGLVYKIASPKDPLPTLARVFSPWSEIARPTRVHIQDVLPGDAEVFRGDSVTVTARVGGVRSTAPVTLFYSTDDGQIVDRPVPMKPTADGLRLQATLPPDPAGLMQDVTYRIAAGDANSPSYRVRVVPAPLLTVEKIDYEYPAYTRRERRSIPKQGDISAVEGTRVTLHARANSPFRSAWIEFAPPGEEPQATMETGESSAKANPVPPERIVHLDANGLDARQTFVLQWDAAEQRPRFGSYVLRLAAEDGQANRRTVVHRIEVFPDLPPEVEILSPAESRIEVPENGRQDFEVRAVDPDFGLRQLSMTGKIANAPALDVVLVEDAAGREGQVTARWSLVPSQFGLEAGDEVTLVAVAQDNRAAPSTGNPAPNIRQSREVTVRIVAARPDSADSPQEKPNADPQKPDPEKPSRDKPEASKPEASKPDTSKPGTEKPESAKPGSEKPDSGKPDSQKPDSPKSSDEKPDSSKPDSKPDDSKPSESKPSESTKPDSKQSDSKQPDSGKPDSGKPDKSKGNGSGSPDGSSEAGKPEDQPNGSGSSADKPPKSASPSQPASGQGAGKQSNDPSQQGNVPGSDDGDPSGAEPGSPDPNQQGSTRPGSRDSNNAASAGADGANADPANATPGGRSSDGASNSKPSEPLDDGDVFEKALELLKQNQARGKDGSGQSRSKESQAGGSTTQKLGDSPQPSSKTDAGKSDGGLTDGVTEPKPSDEPRSPDSRSPAGKPGSGSSGQAGAGEVSRDPQTSPTPLDKNADRPKTPQSGNSPSKPSQETPAPSESKQQSDSQSDSQGDKSGGGGQGGGQGANRKGNDSAGSNTPADAGSGAANQPGAGETGTKPGDRGQAAGSTGAPGRDQGPGSTKGDNGPGASGVEPGKPGEADQGLPESVGGPGNGGTPQRTGGGGLPSDVRPNGAGRDGVVPEGDAANLDYARKATDLVLEYLKDQKDQPDQQLLDRLGWTPDDLRRFVERWEAMKRGDSQVDPRKARELDESLRSLGLRPSGDVRRAAGTVGDGTRDNRDAGARSNPPPKYQDRFDAFRRGTSRAKSLKSEE